MSDRPQQRKGLRMIADFKNVGEAVADERGRLPMGKSGVRKDDRYAVAVNDDGQILLTPSWSRFHGAS